jgi:glyoxylase-like metal-dependent hydrolase (beta-lactamase superfamily II)
MEQCKYYHVKLIVLTHGHFDHAENAARISNALGIPVGMNEKDCNLIRSNTEQMLSAESLLGKLVLSASLKEFSIRTLEEFKPDILLNDGESLSSYGINAKIMALPGHTDGSIGIDVDGAFLMVGDALMNMFYPTVSMLFHNKNDMLESAGKIGRMGNKIIYFGHGRPVSNRQWIK